MSDCILFSPLSLKAYTLKNRIVMSSPSQMLAIKGVPQPLLATYYAQRASAGLIISEPTLVFPTTSKYSNCPGIYNYEQVLAWREITKAVRDRGGKIFLQLWYGSGISPLWIEQKYYDMVDTNNGEAIASTEVTQQMRRGAQLALAADFDGVEINAALGYILDGFLSLEHYQNAEVAKNERNNRIEFLAEIVDAVGCVWDFERVGVRLCPSNIFSGNNDPDPESAFYYIIDSLNFFKLAYVHLLEPPKDKSFLTIEYEQVSDLFRPIYKGTLIVEGDRDPEVAISTVTQNNADLVSFERTFVANSELD